MFRVDVGSQIRRHLHNPWAGGYYPVGLGFEESNRMMADEPQIPIGSKRLV